jgi:hypothetical protein
MKMADSVKLLKQCLSVFASQAVRAFYLNFYSSEALHQRAEKEQISVNLLP